MEKLTKRQIILVIQEIHGIKRYAYDSEKDKLNYRALDPQFFRGNVYGLMTGRMESKAAGKIIRASETKCIFTSFTTGIIHNNVEKVTTERIYRGFLAITPLENFMVRFPEHNENIIDYIKGTTDKLNLTEMVDHKALKTLTVEKEMYIEKIKHFEFLLEVKNDTMTDFEFEAMHDNLYIMKRDVAELTEGINEIEKYLKSKI